MHDDTGLTRRDLLLAVGAATLAASTGRRVLAAGAPATEPGSVPPKVLPFDLRAVRLLDGPFKDAQDRDAKYMLSLEPDRLLHNFRVNAGLEPKAPIYGGWESVAMWADIRAHGHTLGHYLSACAMMHASTGVDEFKKRTDYIVDELAACQMAGKTGLVCAFPDGATQFDNINTGKPIVGVPWYTMHKIFAGLRDAHTYAGNGTAVHVLTKLADWALDLTSTFTDVQFERMLRVEHGGMNEVLADVYELTGDKKYLALAQRFCHKAVLEPLAAGKDALDGLHSNTQIPKIIGFARLHELTRRDDLLAAATFFWKTVTGTRSFATGGNGDNEHFFPVKEFSRHLSSGKTMETCCSHNMLKLTRLLFSHDPAPAYADYYERTLYNTILASQDPDSGMMTYFQPTRPGYLKLFCTPIDSFWCCTGTGIENHSKYGDSIYFRSSSGEDLFVNLFIPSTLTFKDRGLMLTQRTKFPEEPATRLEITADKPVEVALQIRHPAWCDQVAVKVNGTLAATSREPGFLPIKRLWKTGDVVEISLPMVMRTEALPGNPDTIAFAYGPLVLAGLLGKAGLTPGADLIVNERTYGQVLNDPVEVPLLAGNVATLAAKAAPGPMPLTFGVPAKIGERPLDVTLVPYYRVAHERYSLYWKTTSA